MSPARVGRLEPVDDHGILGAFTDETATEGPVRTFYPWSAVLQIASVEGVAEVIGTR